MLTQTTINRLRDLRLRGMADARTAQQQQTEMQALTFEERLGLLVDLEWAYRQNRRLGRLLKAAKLRLPACLEDIDYQQPRGLDRAVMRSLGTCQWVQQNQHILIVGPTGVGKTSSPVRWRMLRVARAQYALLPSSTPAPGTEHSEGRRLLSSPHEPPDKDGSAGAGRLGTCPHLGRRMTGYT